MYEKQIKQCHQKSIHQVKRELSSYASTLENQKRDKFKPKASKRKEIVKIREETNKIENRKTKEKLNKMLRDKMESYKIISKPDKAEKEITKIDKPLFFLNAWQKSPPWILFRDNLDSHESQTLIPP